MDTYENEKKALEDQLTQLARKEYDLRQQRENIQRQVEILKAERLAKLSDITEKELKEFKEELKIIGDVFERVYVADGGIELIDAEPDIPASGPVQKYSIDMGCGMCYERWGVVGFSFSVIIKTKSETLKEIVRNTFIQEGASSKETRDHWVVNWDYHESISMYNKKD
jgi:hypothetical protein